MKIRKVVIETAALRHLGPWTVKVYFTRGRCRVYYHQASYDAALTFAGHLPGLSGVESEKK